MVDNKRDRALLMLCSMQEMGIATIDKLLSIYGTPENIFKEADIEKTGLLTKEQVDEFNTWRNGKKLDNLLAELDKKDIRFVTRFNDEFPEKLKNIHDCPYGLFYRGNLPSKDELCIAVIGARRPSEYGKTTALKISEGLARNGVSVISGLAMGIDSYGHKGALNGNGKTYAVVGGGIDICYPRSNISLYIEVMENGGIISEYPPGMPHLKYHFPMRNRIISGLSNGICVVEAKKISGTGITVDRGLEQGKDVFAVPGRAWDELSEGTNALIQQGAKAVWDASHILCEYGVNADSFAPKIPELPSDEKVIFNIVKEGSATVDELLEKSKIGFDELISVIIKLEIKGLIRQTGPGKYKINL